MNEQHLIYNFGHTKKFSAQRNCVCEIQFCSSSSCADSYNEVALDVIFDGPDDTSVRVPAFWSGDDKWAVRFAADRVGDYRFKSVCSNIEDKGLHGLVGTVTVKPYTGKNQLLQHGRLRVAGDKRHFVHADGTPFFWLGDTWWMAFTERLNWPKDFKALTADRVKKGFNLIQIVAGLYPEMDFGDPRGKNEAGFPLEENFARINPKFYDHVDLKVQHLVESGLMPCIFGSWGYYLPKLGVEKTKKFWRYLVARYGAYPIVWCIAGEGTLPYYLSESKKKDEKFQKKGWCEIASYVREIDPFANLLSIHPDIQGASSANARDLSNHPKLFDFEMLQTGHHGWEDLPHIETEVSKAFSREPHMPVVNSEANYEGMGGQSWQDIQRLSFYISIFCGAIGYTYGANGLWQVNKKNTPYGPSPYKINWGDMPWEEAANLPGGTQVALGAQFLMKFPWWKFEKHQEWVDSQMKEFVCRKKVFCVGIPRQLRLIYVPQLWKPPLLKAIEHDIGYQAYYFDPCTGDKHMLGLVTADEDGNWWPPFPPEIHDWIIVLESC